MLKVSCRGSWCCMVLQVLCDLLTLGLRNIHAAFSTIFFQWFLRRVDRDDYLQIFFSRVIVSVVAPCLPGMSSVVLSARWSQFASPGVEEMQAREHVSGSRSTRRTPEN